MPPPAGTGSGGSDHLYYDRDWMTGESPANPMIDSDLEQLTRDGDRHSGLVTEVNSLIVCF